MTHTTRAFRRSLRPRRKETARSYIVHHNGRPIVAAADVLDARMYVYRRTDTPETTTTWWTGTGKFLVDGRWSGWEVRGVETI
ncbi:hypothetical protein [Streptomyces sp. S1]|uniref:hypothetical protein n=1 Tax=Streptomyces sp. S1 TaxID=718288 RepID=UPI003D71F08A